MLRNQILLGGAFVVVAVLAAAAFSQDGERPLKPADAQVSSLIDQLGDEAYPVRQAAEKKLLALGEKAVPALEKAAKEHPDQHVRFEAERILGRISRPQAGRPGVEELGGDFRRLEERMNEMLKRLVERGLLGEEDLERLREAPGLRMGGGSFLGTVDTGDERIRYTKDAQGRVKVTVTRDGETETYEAESEEALAKEHPQIHALVTEHFGNFRIRTRVLPTPFGGGSVRPFDDWPFGRRPGGIRPGTPTPRETPLREKTDAPPEGFRLGIWLGEMSEPLRAHLGLGAGQGLLVESVVPGSLADRLGMERYDVLLTLNGSSVGGPADIWKSLESVPDGGQVKAVVVRKAKRTTLVATR